MSASPSFLREFMPHGMCYAWQSDILLMNVISDGIIAVSYFSIPVTLVYYLRNRPSLPFGNLVWMFSAFILACGATHIMGIWVVWHGQYGLQGVFKSITALVSIATAYLLYRHMPLLLATPSPVELADANRALQDEVTERTRIEAQFRNFVESAPDATVIVDNNGQIRLVNSQTERMFGYVRNELVGQPVEVLIPSRFAAQHPAYRDNYVASPKARPMGSGRELYGHAKDGTEFPVEISLSSVGTDDRSLVSASIRDITERLAMETQSRVLRTELAHTSRLTSMGEMAAGLAHELNQPLTAITQNTDTALYKLQQNSSTPEELQELLQDIEEEARRGGEIIRALRELVRKGDGEREAFDVNELIEKTIHLLGPEAKDKRVQITQSTSKVIKSFANRVQIAQVIVNLVRNSVAAIDDASSETRVIDIATSQSGEFVQVSVTDTGPGLDSNVSVFAPFETSKRDGMGMGLSISRSIVESHGGRLWVDERYHDGARFLFTLPVQAG